jgi:hypothetical protein
MIIVVADGGYRTALKNETALYKRGSTSNVYEIREIYVSNMCANE